MRRSRYAKRYTKRTTTARKRKADFLLVTLIQCCLCVLMLSAAYFASTFFGMTELKPVFSALLTKETDAAAVFSRSRGFLDGTYDIPLNVFDKKIFLSAPMIQPVIGRLTSPYGCREDAFTGEIDFHTGTDIAAAAGSPVSAAYPGSVVEIGESPIYGKHITLSHGGFETRYCHCMEITVDENDTVAAGETIALVGSTGRSTGPHLHFELLVDGKSACLSDELENWTWL